MNETVNKQLFKILTDLKLKPILRKEISPEEIIDRLCKAGWDTYRVGGFVRDLFRGIDPHDVDIVTAATPQELKRLFSDCVVKLVGKTFKGVLVGGHDIATFRHDRYDEKGNLVIEYADSIHEDTKRRDLTVNSLAICEYTGDVIDDHGGLHDLKYRIIKFVGDPNTRIREDPCRILRTCRFKATLQGQFDGDTFNALKRHAGKIKTHVANERIRLEILKVMKIKRPSEFFIALHDIGGLEYIFPSLELCYLYGRDLHGHYHNESIIDHSLTCGDVLPPNNPLLRLAGYLHDVGKPAACKYDVKRNKMTFHMHEILGCDIIKAELKRLTFANEEIDYIATLARYHMRGFSTVKSTSKLLKKLKDHEINYNDLLRLKIADAHANLARPDYTENQVKNIHEVIKKAFIHGIPKDMCELALSGNVIMDIMNIPQGKKVGEIKQMLLNIVNGSPRLNNKKDLLKLLLSFKKKGEKQY